MIDSTSTRAWMAVWIGAGSPPDGPEQATSMPRAVGRRPASAQTAPTNHVIVESTI